MKLIETYYQKRWSSLRVKTLRIEETILNTKNENTQAQLRSYKDEIEKNKKKEQSDLDNVLEQIEQQEKNRNN